MRHTILGVFAVLAVATFAVAQEPNQDASFEVLAAAPEDGGPRRWQVIANGEAPMREAPEPGSPIIDALAEGAILANLGCQRVGDAQRCNVRPLRGRTIGYVAFEALRPARGPDGSVPMGMDDSLTRARKSDLDLEGQIPCAQERGEPMASCTFGVARGSGGDATVVVTFSNGFSRFLSFAHRQFIRADTTMSGNGFDTDWRIDGGVHFIRVDDQRFELPDTVIFGE